MSTKELKSLVSTMFANIDQDLSEQSFFKTTQEKLGIKPSTICFAVVAIVSILAVLDIAADILTTLFGMAYPAFMSFKAIERKNEEQKNVWLTYWIVFGLLTSIDDSLGFVLDLVPGFYALRFMVYVWMFYPRANNGAMVIYSFLKPYLHRWKQTIEQKSP